MIAPTANGSGRPSRSGNLAAAILGRLATSAATALVALFVVCGVSAYVWLGRTHEDPLQHADAVIVLAGAHDGREKYGLEVARQVSASTLVLSDPYRPNDAVMRHACKGVQDGVTVLCPRPALTTTRGEAMMARSLAAERHWNRIIVVSWRHHLPRARFIFSQCFSRSPGAVLMRAVPRDGPISLAEWEYVSLYQEFALIKAHLQGGCDQ
jgi:uncharacterized SAM-binding protein YcdF (DUF218 family)